MTQPVVPRVFPDIQKVLVEELAVWVGEDHIDTETPDNLQEMLPFIRVIRLGGGRTRLSDYPSVEVEVFASTYDEASNLAERISQWLCGPPPPISVLDKADCSVGPREIPWGDERIRRFVTSYEIVTRRVRAL